MKVGDTVIFLDQGTYKRWFYGKIGTIEKINNSSCRVRWQSPVKYASCGFATPYSHFNNSCFRVLKYEEKQ
jgi:hypothetical protein